ncbi:hypothetical protein HY464_00340 [Candidatus Peregrinibacteria bacterium]|nr:hypothetical protein [Candidatus Peregrinibacteria bacterium]
MHLLALDTDIEGVKRRFLSTNEQEVLTVFRHGFSFFLQTILQVVLTIGLIATGVALNMWDIFPWDIPSWWIMGFLALLWIFLAFPTILKAFLDWKFDFIFVTTDKVVIANQSSLFHHRITPMSLENFASVTAASQCWNLFAFGSLNFQLKEGTGKDMTMKYIPNADEVAAKISDTITQYERRFMKGSSLSP